MGRDRLRVATSASSAAGTRNFSGDGRGTRSSGRGLRCSVVSATGSEPYLPLPSSFDELLSSFRRNARQQVRRNRRRLESAGGRFRTCTGGAQLERDLNSFLRVEASEWKGREGTAIAIASEQLTSSTAGSPGKRPSGAGSASTLPRSTAILLQERSSWRSAAKGSSSRSDLTS